MSMLIERAFVTEGNVKDCSIVIETSEKYRMDQDHFAGFINDRIMVDQSGSVREVELYETFKDWWKLLHGQGLPKGKLLFDYINQKFGKKTGRSWKGISIIKEQESEDEMNELT